MQWSGVVCSGVVARELKPPGGKIDAVESTLDLGHLVNNHDGRLYPRKVHHSLAWVLAPCTLHGDSYRRQEAKVECYNTFVPFRINTIHVGNARCLLYCTTVLKSLQCKRNHRQLHVANAML